MANRNTMTTRQVRISSVSQSKIYDYIKKLEIDGLPRVRAYAEAIDPAIYDLPPDKMRYRLDNVKEAYPNYDEIREMVLAENRDWALRRSGTIQNKAMDLLSNLLDKANDIATNPNADAKELNLAVNTLKSIMPALTAVNGKANASIEPTVDKTKRAAGFIH